MALFHEPVLPLLQVAISWHVSLKRQLARPALPSLVACLHWACSLVQSPIGQLVIVLAVRLRHQCCTLLWSFTCHSKLQRAKRSSVCFHYGKRASVLDIHDVNSVTSLRGASWAHLHIWTKNQSFMIVMNFTDGRTFRKLWVFRWSTLIAGYGTTGSVLASFWETT